MLSRFNIIILSLAVVILGGSLLYANYLSRQLAQRERNAIQLYAKALSTVGNIDTSNPDAANQYMEFVVTNILQAPMDSVPLMQVAADGSVIDALNIPEWSEKTTFEQQQKTQKEYLQRLSGEHQPIKVEYAPGMFQYIYYGESSVLQQLRWFPAIQLAVAFAFVGLLFAGFLIAKRSEQNKVWVGMARETAHQLGTPISSLMGWIELLRLESSPEHTEMIASMETDVSRLQQIAERFSKIGSAPELSDIPLTDVLAQSALYIEQRMSKKILLNIQNELPTNSTLPINALLFSWVIENLLKNALDAILSKSKDGGEIRIEATETDRHYVIDIADTGKGIPKNQWKKIFQPGFTTKKRGWGLGLSLTRRIVEEYHKGKIFVKQSEVGVGTTFRIMLPKQP